MQLTIIGMNSETLELIELVRYKYNTIFVATDSIKQGLPNNGYITLIGLQTQPYFIGDIICIIGSPQSTVCKARIICDLNLPIERFTRIISPNAHVSNYAIIGLDVCIFNYVHVGANVIIGNHVKVLSNTVISHDVKVGDYCTIAPSVNIAGNVSIGTSTYLGMGCCIRENVIIGDKCIIGMGAIVIKNVPNGEKWAGVPARKLIS